MADTPPETHSDGCEHSLSRSGALSHADSSPYRGVRRRSWGSFVSEIRLPGKKTRVWLGSFASAEMAALAYDSAALFLRGSSTSLNFPEMAESLPRPLSASRRDIQTAAAKAAGLVSAGSRKNADLEAKSGEGEVASVMWDIGEEEPVDLLSDVRDAPLHSPPRLEWFLPEGEMGSYDYVNFCAGSCIL